MGAATAFLLSDEAGVHHRSNALRRRWPHPVRRLPGHVVVGMNRRPQTTMPTTHGGRRGTGPTTRPARSTRSRPGDVVMGDRWSAAAGLRPRARPRRSSRRSRAFRQARSFSQQLVRPEPVAPRPQRVELDRRARERPVTDGHPHGWAQPSAHRRPDVQRPSACRRSPSSTARTGCGVDRCPRSSPAVCFSTSLRREASTALGKGDVITPADAARRASRLGTSLCSPATPCCSTPDGDASGESTTTRMSNGEPGPGMALVDWLVDHRVSR